MRHGIEPGPVAGSDRAAVAIADVVAEERSNAQPLRKRDTAANVLERSPGVFCRAAGREVDLAAEGDQVEAAVLREPGRSVQQGHPLSTSSDVSERGGLGHEGLGDDLLHLLTLGSLDGAIRPFDRLAESTGPHQRLGQDRREVGRSRVFAERAGVVRDGFQLGQGGPNLRSDDQGGCEIGRGPNCQCAVAQRPCELHRPSKRLFGSIRQAGEDRDLADPREEHHRLRRGTARHHEGVFEVGDGLLERAEGHGAIGRGPE